MRNPLEALTHNSDRMIVVGAWILSAFGAGMIMLLVFAALDQHKHRQEHEQEQLIEDLKVRLERVERSLAPQETPDVRGK